MASLEKVRYLVKPTQSRKTQHTIDHIKINYESDPETFFIYICHNVIIAKNQTSDRIVGNLNLGPRIVTLSSEEPGEEHKNVLHVNNVGAFDTALTNSILKNMPLIGMCMLAHPQRFKQRRGVASDLERILDRIQITPEIKYVDIYFDEFDAYSSILIKNIEKMCMYKKVREVELVSATYKNSMYLKYVGDIPMNRVIDLRETGCYDRTQYFTYEDTLKSGRFLIRNTLTDLITFSTSFVKKFIIASGYEKFYGFVPGMVKRDTHFELASAMNSLGVSVFLYNSDKKGVYLPDTSFISFDTIDWSLVANVDGSEQSEVIKYMIDTYKLKRVIVTGNLCVGRAVTLQGEGLVFDFAVYHDSIATTGDQLYQLDRTKGNIRRFVDVPPFIVCTEKVKKKLCSAEKYAMVSEADGSVNSIKEYIQEVDRNLYKPEHINLRIVEVHDSELITSDECKRYISNVLNMKSINTVRPLTVSDELGRFKCGYDGRLAVYTYDDLIKKVNSAKWSSKFVDSQLERIKVSKTTGDCIFLRWVSYTPENKPVYVLKILYVF